MHGAGVIDGIAAEKVGGEAQSFYVFKMPVGGLVLKIPVATSSRVGLRRIVDRDEAGRLMGAIPQMDSDMTGNWNRRYRENMERLKSGDLYQVARVIKGLSYRDSVRGLSNGERKMLHTAKQILLSELVLVTGQDYQVLEAAVNAAILGERQR
jgi:CarD family transcriptional regulator